jgi:hypothetical protein
MATSAVAVQATPAIPQAVAPTSILPRPAVSEENQSTTPLIRTDKPLSPGRQRRSRSPSGFEVIGQYLWKHRTIRWSVGCLGIMIIMMLVSTIFMFLGFEPAQQEAKVELAIYGSTGHDWVKATKSEQLKLINESFTIRHKALIGGKATHVPVRPELLLALVDWYFTEKKHRDENATDVIRSAADHRNVLNTRVRKNSDAMRRFGDVMNSKKYPDSIIPR